MTYTIPYTLNDSTINVKEDKVNNFVVIIIWME